MVKKLLAKAVNGLLGIAGLRLVRSQPAEDRLDLAADIAVRGLTPTEHNSRENMDAFYADPRLLEQYFDRDRLAFYEDVSGAVAGLGVSPASLLDVGCGSGHLLERLRRQFPAADLLGVDFSGESVKLARKLHSGIDFQVRSIFELDRLGRQFDLVLCTEVLEHLEDADVALEQLIKTCAPGGRVVITVPDGRNDSFVGHVNFWTAESFVREFRRFQPDVTPMGRFLFIAIAAPDRRNGCEELRMEPTTSIAVTNL
jgi:2-polyprenyl-3-methyl-5-hydroxy-6-metoxy-1,4-benzoquinol methylase